MNIYQKKVLNLIKNNKNVYCLIAPSFPIDFEYPNIINALKKIGFSKVTELTFGARMTNYYYIKYIKENPDQKYYISSPCPTVNVLIKNKYPELEKYLLKYDSPLIATAKIIKKHNPNYKVVFISPCKAKRMLETDNNNIVDETITFKELQEIFDYKKIDIKKLNKKAKFNSFIREYTKIYPISGGLSKTSKISKLFKKNEILITDGIKENIEILEKINKNKTNYRFIDILNCKGGCIGGPDIINNKISNKKKINIIKEYREISSRENMKKIMGKKKLVLDINFESK
ncbi:hypothetical protein K9L04_01720 [Patescibacteria group bacterium]|nr:hypothetical protein [Patescibacteria group bacterium]